MPHLEFVKGIIMRLSEIVEKMCAITLEEVASNHLRLAYDITEVLKRQEQYAVPKTAYWLSTQDRGSFLAFADNVPGSELADYCTEYAWKILRENSGATCRKINFETGEFTEIPAEEFLKTIDHLKAVTGANEMKISADNDPGLYLNSTAYAYRHNEIEMLSNSNRQNAYCADSLYYVVDKDFDGSAAHDHLTSYSLERTIFVAAAAVLNSENASAFDDKVVDWAKSMLDDIPPSVVESAKPIDVKPEALSDFILNKLIPTAEAEAARNAENTESEDTDGLDRF